MSKFEAACYDDKGSMTMSETDKIQLMADNVSLTSTVAERDAEIATHATTIEGLEKAKNAQDVKIATQATTIEGLEKAKNDKDIEIATQATTIDTQATTIKGLEKAKNDKDIEIATLESQLASSQTSLGSAQKAASDENDNTHAHLGYRDHRRHWRNVPPGLGVLGHPREAVSVARTHCALLTAHGRPCVICSVTCLCMRAVCRPQGEARPAHLRRIALDEGGQVSSARRRCRGLRTTRR
jgi:hypothetical protein